MHSAKEPKAKLTFYHQEELTNQFNQSAEAEVVKTAAELDCHQVPSNNKG